MGLWSRCREIVAKDCVAVTLLLAVGVGLRWALIPDAWGHGYDLYLFNNWAQTLHHHPLDQFYATAAYPDHLPGDLWFLDGIQGLYSALGFSAFGHQFNTLIWLFPIVTDMVTVVMGYLVLRRLGCRDLWAVEWLALSPALMAVSAIWGQWDSVSVALLLIGVWCSLRGRWWLLAAGPMFAWAVLVKPQMVAPAAAFAILTAATAGRQRQWLPLAGFVLSGLGWAYVLTAPFRVGLFWRPTGGWSLADRISYAANRWPVIRMSADNVWAFARHPESTPGPQTSDLQTLFGGMSYHQVGTWVTGAVVIAVVVAVTVLLRRRLLTDVEAVLWGGGCALYAAFWLMTRVHERYEFPVVICVLLLGGVSADRRARLLAVAVSAAFLANLTIAYSTLSDMPRLSLLTTACIAATLLLLAFRAELAIGAVAICQVMLLVGHSTTLWPAPSPLPARLDAVAQGMMLLALLSWPAWRTRMVHAVPSPAWDH